MAPPAYRLQDLADRSGVEPRTIRSYIERGLLPGPDSLGRNASYGQGHLARLRAIGLLRDANPEVTLDQIRQLLGQLPESQIRAIAEGEVRIGALIDTDRPPAGRAALDYIAGIRAQVPGSKGRERKRGDLNALEQLLEGLDSLVQPGATPSKPVPARVHEDLWHRVRITPDIELAVRGPLGPDQVAVLRRIGDRMQHLLTRGARPCRRPQTTTTPMGVPP